MKTFCENNFSDRAPLRRHASLVTRHSLRAFTLIEIMVAIAIFMMVLAAIYSTDRKSVV